MVIQKNYFRNSYVIIIKGKVYFLVAVLFINNTFKLTFTYLIIYIICQIRYQCSIRAYSHSHSWQCIVYVWTRRVMRWTKQTVNCKKCECALLTLIAQCIFLSLVLLKYYYWDSISFFFQEQSMLWVRWFYNNYAHIFSFGEYDIETSEISRLMHEMKLTIVTKFAQIYSLLWNKLSIILSFFSKQWISTIRFLDYNYVCRKYPFKLIKNKLINVGKGIP